MQGGERLHADHVVHDSCGVRVVCAMVELVDGACWVLEALIPVSNTGLVIFFTFKGIFHHHAPAPEGLGMPHHNLDMSFPALHIQRFRNHISF